MFPNDKPSFHKPLILAVLSLLFFPVHPAFAKKAKNYTKLLAETARSCKDIDSKVKAGTLQGLYWAEVETEGAPSRWVSYGSKEDAEKAHWKRAWRSAQVYQAGGQVQRVEMEIKTPTKEWVQTITYYFRADGTLQKAHSDFRTFGAYEKKMGPEHQFLAKVLRDRFYDAKGKCVKKSAPRISDATHGGSFRDVVFKDGSWPLYAKSSELPFPLPTPAPAETKKPN